MRSWSHEEAIDWIIGRLKSDCDGESYGEPDKITSLADEGMPVGYNRNRMNTSAPFLSNRDALQAFYDVMNGENWVNSANWNDPDICYCDWYGILCATSDPEECQVCCLYF